MAFCKRCNDTGFINDDDPGKEYRCPDCQGNNIDNLTSWFYDQKFVENIISHGLMGMINHGATNVSGMTNYLFEKYYEIDAKIIVDCIKFTNECRKK